MAGAARLALRPLYWRLSRPWRSPRCVAPAPAWAIFLTLFEVACHIPSRIRAVADTAQRASRPGQAARAKRSRSGIANWPGAGAIGGAGFQPGER